jgi:hypothetical protein
MKLIYIAGRFSAETRAGVERNIAAAEDFGVIVARLGGFPVVPHANTSRPEYEQVQPYQFWIAGTMLLLERCDAVVTVPGWRDSKGATGEVERAKELGMPVFHGVQCRDGADILRADILRAYLEAP